MNSKDSNSEKTISKYKNPELKGKLEEMVATVETGARNLKFGPGLILTIVCISWSIFQLWIASPFPYILSDFVPLLNSTHTRSAHLGFAIFLSFLAFPALKSSPGNHIPLRDWIFAILGTMLAEATSE